MDVHQLAGIAGMDQIIKLAAFHEIYCILHHGHADMGTCQVSPWV